MSGTEQKIEVTMTDTDEIHFKMPLRGYVKQIEEDEFIVGNRDLGITAHGPTMKEASMEFKDKFCELASDVYYKSQYMPLSGRERKKLNIIKSVCDVK